MRYLPCIGIVAACVTGCGASYPAPTQRMADTMAAERSAEEVGAKDIPQGQLHLKLAQEQLAQAKTLMANGENRKAEFMLVRARGDAELALAMSRAWNAKKEAQAATEKAATLDAQNQKALQPTAPMPSQGAPQ